MRMLLALALVGCYSPQLQPCEVHCNPPDDPCPADETCQSDGFCHAADDQTVCETSFLVKVNKHGGGTGDITSDGDIDCGNMCIASVLQGDSITLTATPSGSTLFDGWGGDCTGFGTGDCVLDNVQSDLTADAQFDVGELVNITFSGQGDGAVNANVPGLSCDTLSSTGCAMTVVMGTQLNLTAQELNNSIFNGWGGDCAFSGDFTCAIQVNMPLNIDLDFSP
jgi:hypothetical protein